MNKSRRLIVKRKQEGSGIPDLFGWSEPTTLQIRVSKLPFLRCLSESEEK